MIEEERRQKEIEEERQKAIEEERRQKEIEEERQKVIEEERRQKEIGGRDRKRYRRREDKMKVKVVLKTVQNM